VNVPRDAHGDRSLPYRLGKLGAPDALIPRSAVAEAPGRAVGQQDVHVVRDFLPLSGVGDAVGVDDALGVVRSGVGP
jgi:hypothetical protein